LNVCLVHRWFPPNSGDVGGIVPYYVTMAHALRDAGHEVFVFAEATDELRPGLVQRDGLRVFRYRNPVLLGDVPGLVLRDVAIGQRLGRFIKEHAIDVLEAADYHGESAFLRAGANARVVVKLHTPSRLKDMVLGKRPGPRARVIYALEHRAIRRADILLTPSAVCGSRSRCLLGLPRDATIVPNPVDLTTWRPHRAAARTPSLLFVGRFERYKGLDRLPPILNRVLSRRTEVFVRFVGDEPGSQGELTRQVLQRTSPELRNRIEFRGRLVGQALLEEYQRAAICLVPSRFEAFCYVCAEAMACELPVIGSKGTAMDELIEDGEDGFLVDYDRGDDVAERIEYLLDNADIRNQMGAAARRRIESISNPARVVAEWEQAVASPKAGA